MTILNEDIQKGMLIDYPQSSSKDITTMAKINGYFLCVLSLQHKLL